MIRKELSSNGLFKLIDTVFESIADHRRETSVRYQLKDVLAAGMALFSFKYRSLNRFLEDLKHRQICTNIKTLHNLKEIPSDTQFRDILDPLPPEKIRAGYDSVLRALQRGKKLQEFTVLNNLYPISLDGTGYFSSSNCKCDSCLVKKVKGKDDVFTYHHQMLGAAITHPDYKQVIPLFPEPITNQDGSTKNDCERNASKRWVELFRQHHPKMPALIIEDSLASNAPHIKTLQDHNCHYLLGAKESDHKYLYEQFKINSTNACTEKLNEVLHSGVKVKKKFSKEYEFINGLELNRSNTDIKVNLLLFTEITESTPSKKHHNGSISKKQFAWVTDISITSKNAATLVRIGRRRWAIENETFQTLKKTTDYNIEHNYGHGEKYLATNFAMLCILAFLIDQVQEIVSKVYKEVLEKVKVKSRMWEIMRGAIRWLQFSSWEELFEAIAINFDPNTS
jgi:hypothetical protein